MRENDEQDLVWNTLVRVYGWEWTQHQSLFQLVQQYFISANNELEAIYQKQYDRYLITLDKVQDPQPPQTPSKWCFNVDKYHQYLENNSLKYLT